MEHPDSPYTFAVMPYCNAAPLTHFLARARPGIRVISARPADLVERLTSREADIALIPVVDYFATAGLKMIPGMGICTDGNAWSVLLKCRQPLDQLRTIAFDPASRTSNALARVLLRNHFHLSLQPVPEEVSQFADAVVVIGDRALCSAPAPAGDLDLAGHWKAMTGLPFVFAVWACREDCGVAQDLADIVSAARDAGLQAIGTLAAIHAKRLSLPLDRCRQYLTSVIRYDLGPQEAQGMRLFSQMLDALAGPPDVAAPPQLSRSSQCAQ